MRPSLLACLLLAACNSGSPTSIEVTPATEASRGLPPLTEAAAHVAAAPPGAATHAPAAATGGGLHGKLMERVDAPPYSYLRIAMSTGEVWAAVPQNKLDKGAEVAIDQPMLMHDFTSKTLNRTFAEVYFGTLVGQADPIPSHGGPAAAPVAAPTPPLTTAGADKPIKVEKAKGKDARTIAEIYAQKDALKDHSVVVRGQVTKYNGGILGRNWLHVRDGSGTEAGKNDDLTITTKDAVKVGDVVVVTGTLRLGKDFGAGYAYPVMIEEATVAQK